MLPKCDASIHSHERRGHRLWIFAVLKEAVLEVMWKLNVAELESEIELANLNRLGIHFALYVDELHSW